MGTLTMLYESLEEQVVERKESFNILMTYFEKETALLTAHDSTWLHLAKGRAYWSTPVA